MKRPRGRPREYDPDEALRAAASVFWRRGFAATSLSDLTEATGMNRPSLYAAFGDKRAFYLKALEWYLGRVARDARRALAIDDLEGALTEFYYSLIDKFVSGDAHRGCMVASTAGVEAGNDADVRGLLGETIRSQDAALAERFRRAAEEGQFAQGDAARRGRLATAVLHSLSVRARAGQTRRALRKFARDSVALLAERESE